MANRSLAYIATPLAWFMWALSVAFAALGFFFLYMNGSLSNVLDKSEAIDAAVALAFPPVGVVITSRRPGNWVGWLFCVIGLLQGVTVFGGEYGIYALVTEPGLPAGTIATWFGTWAWLPSLILMGTFLLLLFPNGRLPSRRWRPVAWLAGGLTVAAPTLLATAPWDLLDAGVPAENPFEVEALWPVVQSVAVPMLVVGVMVALLSVLSVILRYRRARGEERQQLKWFVYAGGLSVTSLLLPPVTPTIGDVISVLQIATVPALPVATGIAIVRYRLYDIDRIINRTLVYGALTAMLAGIYVATVVLLQWVLRSLAGGESQLAVVASTLTIAALFNPLRWRIQAFIDRRFYRRKYDAAKTLAGFSARLRDETDLNTLSEDLVSVVRETMQPAHASLWFKPTDGREPEVDQS